MGLVEPGWAGGDGALWALRHVGSLECIHEVLGDVSVETLGLHPWDPWDVSMGNAADGVPDLRCADASWRGAQVYPVLSLGQAQHAEPAALPLVPSRAHSSAEGTSRLRDGYKETNSPKDPQPRERAASPEPIRLPLGRHPETVQPQLRAVGVGVTPGGR